MDITIATEAVERECTTGHKTDGEEYTLRWRYQVRPLRGSPVNRIMSEHGITWRDLQDKPDSGGAQLCMHSLAEAGLVGIVAAYRGGEALTVNGLPVSTPGLRELVLEAFPMLTAHVATSALELGAKLEAERGNLPSAPDSQPSIPTLKSISEAGM